MLSWGGDCVQPDADGAVTLPDSVVGGSHLGPIEGDHRFQGNLVHQVEVNRSSDWSLPNPAAVAVAAVAVDSTAVVLG